MNFVLKVGLGKEINIKNVVIKALYAYYGTLATDAFGVLMNVKSIKLYFSGDSISPERVKEEVINFVPHIVILFVNGKFGNLTPTEGAKLHHSVGETHSSDASKR